LTLRGVQTLEGVSERVADGNFWAEEGRNDRKLEKITY
jgi:hypothetical protein